jgi:hypothetical protein
LSKGDHYTPPIKKIRNSMEFVIPSGCKLIAEKEEYRLPKLYRGDCVFKFVDTRNCSIEGDGTIVIDSQYFVNKYSSACQGIHGIDILGKCYNTQIRGIGISGAAGDCIMVDIGNPRHTLMSDVSLEGATRNGLSIISGFGVVMNNVKSSCNERNGFDIEPEYSDNLLKYIRFTNCRTLSNACGYDIGVSKIVRRRRSNPVDPQPFDIRCYNIVDKDSTQSLLISLPHYKFKMPGMIRIDGLNANPIDKTEGIMIRTSGSQVTDRVRNVSIVNIKSICDVIVETSKVSYTNYVKRIEV